LNLLTKIENREFSAKSDIVLSELINNSLKSLEELIVSKSLKVTAELNSNIVLHINTLMGETLISNLLMNAIKHNFENGKIIIELTDEYLEIKNTGKPPQVEPDKLFERFKKDNQTSDSPGLGLSIVKEICELNKYNVEYNFIKGLHIIKLEF
jgi:signal transduction histidine kinase